MRYSVYQLPRKLENGVDFPDLNTVKWSSFIFDEYTEHRVAEDETVRTWLIAYREYGDIEFEDILFLINGIGDPLSLTQNMVMRIPSVESLQRFLKTYLVIQ